MIGCELVISGSDTPTLLDLVEEPLDEVARAVKARTKADRVLAIAFRRNVECWRVPPGSYGGSLPAIDLFQPSSSILYAPSRWRQK